MKIISAALFIFFAASAAFAASGPIASGENQDGTIIVGSTDSWTFTLNVNDTVIARVGELSGGNSFAPYLRLYSPASAVVAQASGFADAEVVYRATVAGTYTVTVAGYYNGDAGTYRLRMIKTPGSLVVPAGDEGGPLTSGQNYSGTIGVGDVDAFTVVAAVNETLIFRAGEISGGNSFAPFVRVYGPNGALAGQSSGFTDAEVVYRATAAGTYTAVVTGYYEGDNGTYRFRFFQLPGGLVVPAGDEGGPVQNGLNYPGTIEVGDVDAYSVTVAVNDGMVFRVGEISGGNSFSPFLRLYAPDGSLAAQSSGFADAEVPHRALMAGTYTAVVTGYYEGDNGTYSLRFARTGAALTTAADDEGGVLTNGQNHQGTIGVGDVDSFTVTAAANEYLMFRVGEISGGNSFSPFLRLYGPNGAIVAQQSGFADAEVPYRATTAGTYTLVVTGYYEGDNGTYRLSFLKPPVAPILAGGDEGGVMLLGQNYDGAITVGDLDAWSFSANAGATVGVTITELAGGNAFSPRIWLFGPDGALVQQRSGTATAAISYQVVTAGVYTVVASGFYEGDNGTYRLTVTGSATTAPPAIVSSPSSQAIAQAGNTTLAVTATGSGTGAFQWWRNSTSIGGATTGSLALTNFQPADAGIYWANVTGSGLQLKSASAIVGLSTANKLVGLGTEFADILHPATGFTYDQILLQGPAATVTADSALNQILRISFLDLNDDIVQVEFAGPGTLTLLLDNVSGPATPLKYIQPNVAYMKGHASIVVTGATEQTNLSVFSVGRLVNGNPALYRNDVTYDGFADLAFVAISSANGQFGGLRSANASYFANRGYTGVYAPGVQFTGPVFVGEINAFDTAAGVFLIGSGPDTRVTGGDLHQSNGLPVQVSGLTQLKFGPGSSSHGVGVAAQANKARLEQNGVDVTTQIVVNP